MANIQKTAIVTGGSQAIGAGVVKAFLDRGYNVVANSRNITKANPFPRKAAQRNSSGVAAELDVEAGRKAARLAANDLVADEGVSGSHPERAAVVAFRGPILSRELRPAALSSDGRKKSKLLGTFPVYRRL
jgi:NAD(P)-dependent dehydrogenase (short-subunit alcohol dehydrogenase family)